MSTSQIKKPKKPDFLKQSKSINKSFNNIQDSKTPNKSNYYRSDESEVCSTNFNDKNSSTNKPNHNIKMKLSKLISIPKSKTRPIPITLIQNNKEQSKHNYSSNGNDSTDDHKNKLTSKNTINTYYYKNKMSLKKNNTAITKSFSSTKNKTKTEPSININNIYNIRPSKTAKNMLKEQFSNRKNSISYQKTEIKPDQIEENNNKIDMIFKKYNNNNTNKPSFYLYDTENSLNMTNSPSNTMSFNSPKSLNKNIKTPRDKFLNKIQSEYFEPIRTEVSNKKKILKNEKSSLRLITDNVNDIKLQANNSKKNKLCLSNEKEKNKYNLLTLQYCNETLTEDNTKIKEKIKNIQNNINLCDKERVINENETDNLRNQIDDMKEQIKRLNQFIYELNGELKVMRSAKYYLSKRIDELYMALAKNYHTDKNNHHEESLVSLLNKIKG